MKYSEIVDSIYKYRLSIECKGTWFMVYRGDNRPVDIVKERDGFFTWRYVEVLNLDKALAYELCVSTAVEKAVDVIRARQQDG